MGYLFETELREEAEKYIKTLGVAGIQGRIAPDGFRDYLVKLSISVGQKSFGNINLYYSPNKKSFSLKTHELKEKSIIPELETAWASNYPSKLMTQRAPEGNQPASLMEYEAYVDGSYIDGPIGYGALILKDGKSVFEVGATVQIPTLLEMRQVGGELQAVYTAIEWCQNNHVQLISVFYDYEGIERWATGTWKANNPATQAYARFIQECGIQILWNKVKSHSGNHWNDYVDRLAKQGSQGQKTATSNVTDELSKILEKARDFVVRLQQESITADVLGIINGQFVRLTVRPRGQVDIYNTLKRTPDEPYFSNIPDLQLQQKIAALWKSFYRGDTVPADLAPKKVSPLAEVEHFYTIMAPYRDCWFDFSEFANALARACENESRLGKFALILKNAHDFTTLETVYQQIKAEGNH